MNYRIAFFLVAATGLAACQEPEPQAREEVVRPIRAIQVGMNEELAERRFPGRAAAANDVTLAFEVSGKLNQVRVSVGDRVKKGDVLAELDGRDFQNALDQASAEAKRTRAQYQRMKRALADKAVSRQGVTDALAAYESAQAMLKIRQKALDDTKLVAPYDAIVSATYIDSFGNVRAKQPAIRLVDPSRIEMEVDLPESLITFAKRGMEVRVTFDAFPDTMIAGAVSDIGAEADEATRTYPVSFIMEQPEGIRILPGMAGKAWPADMTPFIEKVPAEFHGHEVPITAILSERDNQTHVWVIDPDSGRVARRQVVTGDVTEGGILVRGLEGGETIATAGVNSLVEGQQVRVIKKAIK